MLSVPAGNEEVVNFATPPVRVAVPSAVLPLLKVTVSPLVLPAPNGESVAVSVTDCPTFAVDTLAITVSVVGVVVPAFWVTVKVCPAIAIVPVRALPGLASTV
jgi:hypothetical protein